MIDEFKCPPVMICGFNRPDCLKQVFERVREAKPAQLFLVLDAPREGRQDDVEKNNACKKVLENIDWPCEVVRDYAEKNLGCRKRMASGITNVFKHVEQCIILEDDCVPSAEFFSFARKMLEKYKDDSRVGLIAGHIQHYSDARRSPRYYRDADYYFDHMNTIWGWATWRRAWKFYDDSLSGWDSFVEAGKLGVISKNKRVQNRFKQLIRDTQEGRTSSWAIVWWANCVMNGMLCLHPCGNLITNIGCGVAGTHCKVATNNEWANLPYKLLPMTLRHPKDVVMNRDSQDEIIDKMYAPSLASKVWRRVLSKIKRMVLG